MRGVLCALPFLATAAGAPLAAQEKAGDEARTTGERAGPMARAHAPAGGMQQIVRDGHRVALELIPAEREAKAGAPVRVGERVRVRLWLSDASTDRPMTDFKPAAWVDVRRTQGTPSPKECKQRINGYLPKKMKTRPVVDLNSYVVLGLNRGNTISVLDPFFGFGNTRLLTTVRLPGEGEDWALAADARRLYVTIPLRNLVAVVSTDTWDVVESFKVETTPTRVLLGPRGRLWVGTDGGEDAGVAIVDPRSGEIAAHLATGGGHHEIVFHPRGRVAYVTNPAAGTVSAVDTKSLEVVKRLETGSRPADLAYSTRSDELYVVDREDGTIMAYDGGTLAPAARLTGSPGLRTIRFDPSDRWGFVLNRRTDEVHILDATSDSVKLGLVSEGAPDHVAFTENFAYVRSRESSAVMMVSLRSLRPGAGASDFARDFGSEGNRVIRTEGGAAAIHFPAGQAPPGEHGEASVAPAITVAPHARDAVYVPNPTEKSIYFYHYMEGMPTPAGNLKTSAFEPKAALTVGRRLHEVASGVYEATIEAPPKGNYSVNFLLDEPRIIHCFPFRVEENPRLADRPERDLRIARAEAGDRLRAGEKTALRFRILDRSSGEPRADLSPVARVISPGGWFTEAPARGGEDGVYRVSVTVPEPGAYYLTVSAPGLNRGYEDQRPLLFHAAPPAAGEEPASGEEPNRK